MAEGEKKTFDVERIQRNPWITALAASPLGLIPLLWAAAVATGEPVVALPTVHLAIIGAFTSFWAWRRNPWRKKARVRVEVDGEAITVGDERIERSTLSRGVIVPREGDIEVHLAKLGPDLEVRVKSAEDARRLLSSLGFDADQSVAAFRTMSQSFSSIARVIATAMGTLMGGSVVMLVLGLIAGAIGGEGAMSAAMAGGWMLTLLTMFTLMFAPSRIEVGADGVLIRWLGRQRFVSHGDVEDVQQIVAGLGRSRRLQVQVKLRSGEVVRIPVTHPRWDDGRTAALATRILEAREVYRRGGAEDNAFLMRGDRPHLGWVSALRTRELVGHRDRALPKDRLWRVIEDAAAKPLERAAAAIALGKELAEPERARLARAAKASAVPKLRVVLENVADAEDDELAEQLMALEGEKRKK